MLSQMLNIEFDIHQDNMTQLSTSPDQPAVPMWVALFFFSSPETAVDSQTGCKGESPFTV